MKKSIVFIALTLLLLSCTDDVVFNNPSVQGLKNNVFWRALQSKAMVSKDGSVVIEANTLNETLKLHFSSTAIQEAVLDLSKTEFVTFTSKEFNPALFLSTKDGLGTGKMSITEYDARNKTVTGTYNFVIPYKLSMDGEEKELYFSQGVFYKVPVVEETTTLTK